MKKIILLAATLITVASGIKASTASAQCKADQVLFQGIMLSRTIDPYAAEKNAISFDGSKKYIDVIKQNAAGQLINMAELLVNGERTHLEQILLKKPYETAKDYTLRKEDYTNGLYNINPKSLRGIFADQAASLAHNQDKLSPELVLVAKMDVVQRLLYILFKRLPEVAQEYANTYKHSCLLPAAGQLSFTSLDPLSKLYNEMTAAVDADAAIPTAKQAAVKKYIIASALLFREKLIAPQIPTHSSVKSASHSRTWLRKASKLLLISGYCAYCASCLTMEMPDDVKGTVGEYATKAIFTAAPAALTWVMGKR